MIIGNENKALRTNLSRDNGVDFRINASAHAFQILSSAIYEHKIAAVVRELCTNAFDSHIQAGKPEEPFSVVLPTEMHPYFEVEDFGIGMSMEDAITIYTVYFASTKGATNEVAGGLGLGSKTPFAYTKQFSVRIRKDGVENTALIYVDATGAPRMDIIHTQDTTEPNGVKVTVPVEAKDFSRFMHEAKFFLSFYPVTPTFNTDCPLNYPEVSTKLEVDGHAYVKQNSNVSSALANGKFYAVMGPVPYAVDVLSMIDDRMSVELLRQSANQNGCLFVKFDIGELAVSASRESLSMDVRTQEAIKTRFLAVVKEVRNKITKISNDEHRHPMTVYKEFIDEFGGDFYVRYANPSAHMLKVRRELKIPNLGISTIRRGYSKSGNYFLARKFKMMDFFGEAKMTNVPGVIRILALDCDKQWKRDLFIEAGHDLVYKRALSDHQKSRIEELFQCTVEIVSYAELYKKMLADRRARKAAGTQTVRIKHAKTSIIASGVVVEDNKVYELKSQRMDIDSHVYTVERRGSYFKTDNGTDLGYNFSTIMDIGLILGTHFDMPQLTIVVKNGRNAKRLNDHKVQCISELINKFVDETKTGLEMMVKSSTAASLLLRYQQYNMYSDFNLIRQLRSKQIPSDVMAAYEKLCEFRKASTGVIDSSYEVFYKFYSETDEIAGFIKEMEEQQAIVDEFIELHLDDVMNRNYPLLSGINYSKVVRPTVEHMHCLKYVEMVDSVLTEPVSPAVVEAAPVEQIEEKEE